jgi:RNase P subunit RPR2
MPCYDSRDSHSYVSEAQRKERAAATERLNTTTRLLCETCQDLLRRGIPLTSELRAWWETHQVSEGHIK